MKLGKLGEVSIGLLDFLYKQIKNTRLFLALAVIGLFAYCFTQIETTFTTIATTNSTVNIDSELKGGLVDMAKGLKDALLLIVGFFFMSKASEGGAKQAAETKAEPEETNDVDEKEEEMEETEPEPITNDSVAETVTEQKKEAS
jgi:hypothetical protein